eukprot:TRINITY_DN27430_c0_g1_i1.p1 TRINITY_DN27430_c0_g1~~TRINITY_DN27430_c0_g1_i1.p1  ORF type:complete len:798 (+),score=182.01 TRINITY_DN27430_c0_g1_i1:90-2483(+)
MGSQTSMVCCSTRVSRRAGQHPTDLQWVSSFLGRVPLIKKLDPHDRQLVAAASLIEEYQATEAVVRQGDSACDLFVICEGICTVVACDEQGKELRTLKLKGGDFFGESALLYNEMRTATVTALTRVKVLKISQDSFLEHGLQTKLHFANRRAINRGNAAHSSHRKSRKQEPGPKTDEDISFMSKAIHGNENLQMILGDLPESKVEQLLRTAWLQTVPEGEKIIRLGDTHASFFYIVRSGSFEVWDNADPDAPESYDLGLDAGLGSESPRSPKRTASRTVLPVRVMEVGSCFGELALLYRTPRTRTVKAQVESEVWVMERRDFKGVLMSQEDEEADKLVTILNAVHVLDSLAEDEKRELANALVDVHFEQDEVILKQGDVGETFYILTEGQVSIDVDGKKVRELQGPPAQYFGERGLLGDERVTATVTVVSSHAELLALDRETFDLLLGPLVDIMNKARPERHHADMHKLLDVEDCKREPIAYSTLQRVTFLGSGAFGNVELYQRTATEELYALKEMAKDLVEENHMEEAVQRERDLLLRINSPWIIKLHAAYNWKSTLGLLLEYLPGGELFAVYVKNKFFGSEPHARYYIAGMVCALEHLVHKRVIYRDLKPENVALSAEGVPKLLDFGLAKVVIGKTYTTCGTPEYFAPEVIRGHGSSQGVDWWALGVVCYELMTGSTPFRSAQAMTIFRKVTQGIEKVPFSKKCEGPVGEFVRSLLKQVPSERLPMRHGGVENIRKHEWYKGFAWEHIDKQSFEHVPFQPMVKNVKDRANGSAQPVEARVEYRPGEDDWAAQFAT